MQPRQKRMKARMDSSINLHFVFALALILPIFVTATGSTGTSVPFRYSENNLQACDQIEETKNENKTVSIDGVNDPYASNTCLALYKKFVKHYGKGDNLSDVLLSSSPRYAHFAKTAELIHQHNTRQDYNDSFKMRLNQFADTSRSYTIRDPKKKRSFAAIVETPEVGESKRPVEGSSLSAVVNWSSKNAHTCQIEGVSNPIATVKSWGLLHKNHEALIEYALLYVGPVAVGINAADSSFINYGGGIFDSHDCDQTVNHALLIVGYGEEDITNQKGGAETARYWIARN